MFYDAPQSGHPKIGLNRCDLGLITDRRASDSHIHLIGIKPGFDLLFEKIDAACQ